MMSKVIRTVYNMSLEAAKMVGAPYTPTKGTTLNDKYGINIAISDSDIPTIKYYGIGIAFKRPVDGDILTVTSSMHSSTDADLYYPAPFLIRKESVGLTTAEDKLYRIKVHKQINGVKYILCYLKVIDSINFDSDIYSITLNDTNDEYTITSLDTTDTKILNPVPRKEGCDLTKNFTYSAASQKLDIQLTKAELQNIKQAVDILYDTVPTSERYQIGEVCLFSGVDSILNGKVEAGAVQAGFFKDMNVEIASPTDNFEYSINIGGMTPMIV